MKIDRTFPKQVLAALVVLAIVAAYPLTRYGSADVVLAVVVGAILSTVNVLLGFLAIEYSFGKSYTTFLKAVLGGMGVRMVLMLGALLLLITLFEFHAVALTVSLLGFYTLYLVLEVMFIQRKVHHHNGSDSL